MVYELWELTTMFLATPCGGRPEHPIVIPPWSPPAPGVPTPPIYYPPIVWPPVPPSGGGVPTPPIDYPPEVWPPEGVPTPPIYYPPGVWEPVFPTPPIVVPVPPDTTTPPGGPPIVLPDFASPGFWAYILVGNSWMQAWVQVAFNTDPGHVPQPPTAGLPGAWTTVDTAAHGPLWAWVPTPA